MSFVSSLDFVLTDLTVEEGEELGTMADQEFVGGEEGGEGAVVRIGKVGHKLLHFRTAL